MNGRLAPILGCVLCLATVAQSEAEYALVTSPPVSLQLDPFYTRHVAADGIPVVSSGRTPDAALLAAADIVRHILAHRSDLRDELIKARVRVAVMAENERTTDIPEHRDLRPRQNWDRRARGLGATAARPAVSCAEENLLGYETDRYLGESILVHEFAHTIHEMALKRIEPDFDARLQALYDEATSRGLWRKTYAAGNPQEYWAEGVQSWFDANLRAVPPNGIHNHVCARESLERYDAGLANLVAEVFRNNPWRWTRFGPAAARAAESWKITIQGNDAFTSQVAVALALLQTKSPDSSMTLEGYIGAIKQGQRSATWAYRKPPVIELNDLTAFRSATWLAGVLAHEAEHARLYHDSKNRNADQVPDEVWIGPPAERRCLDRQLKTLEEIGAPSLEIEYCRSCDGRHSDVDGDGNYDWKDFGKRTW